MAGNENSGRSAGAVVPCPGIRPGVWPWERRRKGARPWSADRIRRHLEAEFSAWGLVTDPLARDALMALADAHHIAQLARDAIRDDPTEPKVGMRCAYVVLSAAYGGIARSIRVLGIWPLKRGRPRMTAPALEGVSHAGSLDPSRFAPPEALTGRRPLRAGDTTTATHRERNRLPPFSRIRPAPGERRSP